MELIQLARQQRWAWTPASYAPQLDERYRVTPSAQPLPEIGDEESEPGIGCRDFQFIGSFARHIEDRSLLSPVCLIPVPSLEPVLTSSRSRWF